MEKPKVKKGIRQSPSVDTSSPSWYSKPVTITPKRCHNVSNPKPPNCRQAGDTRRQDSKVMKAKNADDAALHLKYGRFNNLPNFARPGRPRQKPEAICMAISPPKRGHLFKSNIGNNEGYKSEQQFLAQKSDRILYQHLSLSEVMHIDIKPPRNTKASSPIQLSSPLMSPKYKPSRARSPRRS